MADEIAETGEMSDASQKGHGEPILPADTLIGQTIAAHYLIEERLGNGGMSAVYKARHLLLSKECAVKLISKDLLFDAGAVMRFQQEARATSFLNHENIAAIREFGLDAEGRPFIAMDFIAGQPLSAILKERGRLPLAETIEIIRQVLAALSHAHQQMVIHRDIKPENILVSSKGGGRFHVSVVDFGIAKLLGVEDKSLTKAGDILGSPCYMSPEQCYGKDVDARSDLYAVGCVMYECLTGRPPFDADGALETLMLQASAEVADFSRIAPEIAPVVMRSLQKNPGERYQSAQLMEQDLSIVESGGPVGIETAVAGTTGAGTTGAGTSGAGTTGAGTTGAGTSGAGTTGAGTSGAGTTGAGTSGADSAEAGAGGNSSGTRSIRVGSKTAIMLVLLVLILAGALAVATMNAPTKKTKPSISAQEWTESFMVGQSLFDAGDFEKAREALEGSLAQVDSLDDSMRASCRAVNLDDLADLSSILRLDSEAMKYFELGKQARAEEAGVIDRGTVTSMLNGITTGDVERVALLVSNQSTQLQEAGRFEESRLLLSEAIPKIAEVCGKNDSLLASLYFDLAISLSHRCMMPEAIANARRGLEISGKSPPSVDIVKAFAGPIVHLYSAEDIEKAESLGQQFINFAKAQPALNSQSAIVYLGLAQCARLTGKAEQASAFARQADWIAGKIENDRLRHLRQTEVEQFNALLLSEQGQIEKALQFASTALRKLEKPPFRKNFQFVAALKDVARLESRAGHVGKAQAAGQRCLAAATRTAGKYSKDQALAAVCLAEIQTRSGAFQDAVKSYKIALACGERSFPTYLYYPSLMCDVSKVYAKTGETGEQEAQLLTALSLIERNNFGEPGTEARLRFILNEMDAVLKRMGRRAEIPAWHERMKSSVLKNRSLLKSNPRGDRSI